LWRPLTWVGLGFAALPYIILAATGDELFFLISVPLLLLIAACVYVKALKQHRAVSAKTEQPNQNLRSRLQGRGGYWISSRRI
jgi:hypothetical protein